MGDRPETAAEMIAVLKEKYPTFLWPKVCDFTELKEEASVRVLKIWEDWNRLRGILERHENTLRRRWTKKTAEQRKKVLLTAWPDIPVSHRPDMQALHRETAKQREEATRFRDVFLFPYVNLEDLAQARPLLLLLNSRGHNQPHKFAANELKSARVGLSSGAISQRFLYGYKMIFEDQNTPQTYGQLCSSTKDTTSGGMEPGEGIIVLEVQQRLLRFLERCTELILHDLPLHDMTIPVQLPAPFDENPGWASLTRTRAEAPYRLPDACEFGRLQEFIHAKCAEAMDHMWLLREDPGYFQGVMYEWSEHRNEVAFSAEGKRPTIAGEVIVWEKATRDALIFAYRNLLNWNMALGEFSKLWAIGTKDCMPLHNNKSIVESSRIEYAHFSYLLTQMRIWLLIDLRTGILASPPLRADYTRVPGGSNTTDIRFTRGCLKPRDSLLDLIDALTDWTMVSRWGLHNLLDELERVLQSDKKQRERISPWVAHILSDLTVIAELERQMSLYQPDLLVKIVDEGLTEDLMEREYTKRTLIIIGVVHGFRIMPFTMGSSVLRKCCYPSDKQRTAQRTREMINAETKLDAFWTKIDKHFVAKAGANLHEVTRILFPNAEWARDLQRTPEWSQPALTPIQGRTLREASCEAFSALDLENRTQITISTDTATPTKAKIKTRRQATDSAEAAVEAPVPAPSITPPTISVHKRAYKTFTTLFHTTDTDDMPGEISWADFLQAMSSVGFAVSKLDGSAWMFKPQDEVQRGIIFHEPHPHSKIPLIMARRHGRRLQRAYGWTAETFVRA